VQSSSTREPAAAPRLNGPAELRTKLTWLAAFRVSVTSLLLIVLGARRALGPTTELSHSDQLAFFLIGTGYVLTLAYAVALRRGIAGRLAAYVQVLGDVVLASSVIFLTGAGDSPFTFAYSVAVIAAALLLYERGALVAAAASSIAFAFVVLGVQFRVVTPPLEAQHLSPTRLFFVLSTNGIAQLTIGVLSGYLSRQLAAAGGRVIAGEARIEQLVDLQNLIMAAMPSGLITCDQNGRVTFINRSGETILGRRGDEWPLDIEALLPGARGLAPGVRRSELQVPTPAGPRVLGLTATPLDARSGSTLFVFQDLTDLRRAEEKLRIVDHLASLGKFSAQLAHEIRNPLASMRGAAQMLGNEADGDASARKLTSILIRESDRLSGLVEDFLRFARPPPPTLEAVDLGNLVTETVEMLKPDPLARGVSLEVAAASVRGQADSSQLQQVIINLVRNALVAVGPGGRVKVSTGAEAGRPEIRVWDSGGKIPPADLVRIFEPFYTTKAGGTGLGLSTAHTIVRAHGGEISVSSAPGAGTEFVVALQSVSGEARADPGR
jgi:two-component system sensor histidine kinase PilS (NtrC family)